MPVHPSIASRSYWIDVDEAATLLSARHDEVICLVQEGILVARRHGTRQIALWAAEVASLAAVLPQPARPRRRRLRASGSHASPALPATHSNQRRAIRKRSSRRGPSGVAAAIS
jgi:hypothetical protein